MFQRHKNTNPTGLFLSSYLIQPFLKKLVVRFFALFPLSVSILVLLATAEEWRGANQTGWLSDGLIALESTAAEDPWLILLAMFVVNYLMSIVTIPVRRLNRMKILRVLTANTATKPPTRGRPGPNLVVALKIVEDAFSYVRIIAQLLAVALSAALFSFFLPSLSIFVLLVACIIGFPAYIRGFSSAETTSQIEVSLGANHESQQTKKDLWRVKKMISRPSLLLKATWSYEIAYITLAIASLGAWIWVLTQSGPLSGTATLYLIASLALTLRGITQLKSSFERTARSLWVLENRRDREEESEE